MTGRAGQAAPTDTPRIPAEGPSPGRTPEKEQRWDQGTLGGRCLLKDPPLPKLGRSMPTRQSGLAPLGLSTARSSTSCSADQRLAQPSRPGEPIRRLTGATP